MNLHHMVVDDFFEEPWELRNWALERGFKDEVSPVDQMTYKGVCKDPAWVFQHEAEVKLSYLLRSPAAVRLAFLRLTMERVVEDDRRIVHLDHSYAGYVCTVYLNPPGQYPPGSGTWILKHDETDMERVPSTQEELDIWIRDCNDVFSWRPTGVAEMMWNRAIIMSTQFFHMSKPTGGFGNNPTEGRMVFVAFFDI